MKRVAGIVTEVTRVLIDSWNRLVASQNKGLRVEERVALPIQTAAAATATFPFFVAPCDLSGLSITIIAAAALTGDNTNRKNFNVVNLGTNGTATEIGNYDPVTGDNLTANVPHYIPLSADSMLAGQVLGLELEKIASGVIVPNIEIVIGYFPTVQRTVQQRRSLILIPAQAAADATVSYPFFAAPAALSGLSVRLYAGAAITGADTNTRHLNFIQTDTAGINPVELAHRDLVLGTDLSKGIPYGPALASVSLAIDRPIKLESEKIGSGQALPPLLLVIDWTLSAVPASGQVYYQLLVPGTAAADATQQTHLLYRPGIPLTALAVSIYPGASVTGVVTDNKHLNLIGGTGATELDAYDLDNTFNLTAMDAKAFTLTGTEKIVDADDKIKLEVEKIGNGLITPALLVVISARRLYPRQDVSTLEPIVTR